MPVTPAHWKRLSPLLDAALDLEPGQREVFLASLPAEDAQLRDELRELLAGREGVETDDFMNRLPAFSAVPKAFSLGPDSIVGPYRLIREIGAGGTSSVWLAERVDGTIQRKVALKLPHLGLVDRGIAARIARERDILASLEHPNIARLYDAGVDERGRPYLALEYVDGVPPDVYCRREGLNLRDCLAMFLKVLHAVSFAHARLVVHRDLKPNNILISAGCEVRLLDFGIARLLQPEASLASHTLAGAAALTPAYAAPEQFTGQPVTVATDVYSLGVILFELLTDVSPYSPDGRSLGAYEHEVRYVEPPRASRAAVPSEAGELKGDLDAIVAKALEKNPAERYSSVEAFAQDIERHLAAQPIAARPRSFAYVTRKFLRRNALPLALGITVVAALSGALGVAAIQWRDAEQQRGIAVDRLANSQAASTFMTTILMEGMQPGESLTFEQLIARSEKIARQAGRTDVRTRVFAADFLAGWYRANGMYRKADELLTTTIDSMPPDQADVAKGLRCMRAEIWGQIGRAEEGERVLDHEIATPTGDDAVLSQCLIGRSYFAAAAGDGQGAMVFGLRALDKFRAAGTDDYYTQIEILLGIGAAEGLNGDYDAAHAKYAEALEILTANGRERGRAAANLHDEWASVWMNAGNYSRALAELDLGYQILRELTPTAELNDDRRRYRRARILAQLARFPEADAEVASARTLSESRGNMLTIAGVQIAAAEIAVSRGDFAGALRLLDGAREKMRDANVPPGHVLNMRYTMFRAAALAGLGRNAEARTLFTQAIQGYETRNCCKPQISFALAQRGETWIADGDLGAADTDAARARELAQTSGADSFSRFAGRAWYVTGRLAESRGNARAARDAFATAAVQLAGSIGDAHPETRRARDAITRVTGRIATQKDI